MIDEKVLLATLERLKLDCYYLMKKNNKRFNAEHMDLFMTNLIEYVEGLKVEEVSYDKPKQSGMG